MNPLDLFKTTALRLVVRYLLIYLLVLGAALAAFIWITGRYLSSHLVSGLNADLHAIVAVYNDVGVSGAAREIERLITHGSQGRFYLLVSAAGERLAGNLGGWPEESEISFSGEVENAWLEETILPIEVGDDEVYWPVVATRLSGGEQLLLTQSVEQVEALNDLVEFLVEVLGAAVLLSLLLGVTIGRVILRRIQTVSDTAAEIMAGDLSRRIAVSGRNDEFDTLATRLNAMLDRIEGLISSIRNVTDNVAHDLRSPLTRLRNHLEVTLLERRDEQEYRDALGRAVSDTESLINTFNALLRIAQVESGNHREQWERFDPEALVDDLIEIYRPLAEERGQQLSVSRVECCQLFGNRNLIAQALSNLLDNALKYAPQGGRIELRMVPGDRHLELHLSDNGPGIPVADRQRVFDRFTRLESSRHLPGNGLGLSLVWATCRLHGAEIVLEDANPGVVAIVRFPCARRR